MGYILKNTQGLLSTRLTDTARLKLSQGSFNISYFQVGDSEVSYNSLPDSYNQFTTQILEPAFNAQNSTAVPETNKQNVNNADIQIFAGAARALQFMPLEISQRGCL